MSAFSTDSMLHGFGFSTAADQQRVNDARQKMAQKDPGFFGSFKKGVTEAVGQVREQRMRDRMRAAQQVAMQETREGETTRVVKGKATFDPRQRIAEMETVDIQERDFRSSVDDVELSF